jgi:hypothetical protein
MIGVKSEREALQQQAQRLSSENGELTRSAGRLRARLALLDRDYRQVAERLAHLQGSSGLVASTAVPVYSAGSSTVVSVAGPTPQPPSLPQEMPAPAAPVFASSTGTVELPPIIVKKDRAGISMPLTGRLIEVNEPHGFVVVDRGSQDGVRVGMVFEILRAHVSVGRARVVRVRPNLAACDLVRAQTGSPMLIGDTVVQRTDE